MVAITLVREATSKKVSGVTGRAAAAAPTQVMPWALWCSRAPPRSTTQAAPGVVPSAVAVSSRESSASTRARPGLIDESLASPPAAAEMPDIPMRRLRLAVLLFAPLGLAACGPKATLPPPPSGLTAAAAAQARAACSFGTGAMAADTLAASWPRARPSPSTTWSS